MTNEYTARWFGAFLDTVPDEWTANEVAGITSHLPRPEYSSVLDICCGTRRHAAPLTAAGYRITGVDRDRDAIARARARTPDARFEALDHGLPCELTRMVSATRGAALSASRNG